MPASLLLVLPTDGTRLDQTLTSLDRQTSPPDRFDVLLVDDQQDQVRTQRLRRLASARSNVSWLAGSADESLVPQLDGREHVVFVEPGDTFFPDAVDHLARSIARTPFDVMLAKTARPGARVESPVLLDDLARIATDAALRFPECGRVYTSDLVRSLDASLVRRDRRRFDELALREAEAVVWCDRPVFAKPRASRPTATRWEATATSTELRTKQLVVSVKVAPEDDASTNPPTEVSGLAVGSATGVEWPLATTPVDGSPVEWTLALDLAEAAGGAPLPAGEVLIALLVTDQAGSEVVPVRVLGTVRQALHLAGTSYVVHGRRGRLVLDVGGVAHPVARRIEVATARVVEDARGSLLSAVVPRLQIAPGERLEGLLRVGDLPLVAWIEADDNGAAVLRSWVSGLPGTYKLAISFSRSGFVPLRARLVVDPVGRMRVEVPRQATPRASAQDPAGARRTWRRLARRIPGAGRVVRSGRSAISRVRGARSG